MPSDKMSKMLLGQDSNTDNNPDGSLSSTGSNLAPPAPPPMQPITPSHNPYDFITQSPPSKRKGKLFSGGSSKKQRILIVMVGLVGLAILAVVVIGLLGSSTSGAKNDYLSLLEQQTELIRVSSIGMTKSQRAEAKNLAYTTNYSLVSEQLDLLKLAKKAGVRTDAKHLALSKNSQNDTLLTNAAQTNQFDSVFVSIMQANLKKYQATLKKLYDGASTKTTKDILAKDYANASLLVENTPPSP